jgi:predicted transcriptional regulator of viral defense system
MKKPTSPTDEILKIAKKQGVLRIRDITKMGIHPELVRRLYAKGLLIRTGRGLYTPADADLTVHHSLVEAAKRVPHGIVCLLSALSFHGLGTQMPHEVWLALDRSARRPRVDYPPLRIVRFSGRALSEGVEEHLLEGVPVQIYCPSKTVVDCFKYRNKIGLDVALEALRECWRERRCTANDLVTYANVCRVWHVMRPYLESVV